MSEHLPGCKADYPPLQGQGGTGPAYVYPCICKPLHAYGERLLAEQVETLRAYRRQGAVEPLTGSQLVIMADVLGVPVAALLLDEEAGDE